MVFRQRRKTLFTASIDSSNSATLNGSTVASEAACAMSTLPADLFLWHHCFTHHNYADVKKMVEHKLVTGLVLDSDNKPDPICELCIAGKISANPFPPSANHNCFPLALVHSDLHGPLPVATYQGYKYWITCIDNSTHFRSIHLLKFKSQAFEAFKDYKVWAENQLSAKILELQDDKGDEYMSKEFLQFTTQHGIQRRHSTQNQPQQNGLAKQTNKTMEDCIIAMLAESGLSFSFWSYCLASMVHVWNHLPTAFLPNTTPFEAFYKCKPDVSYFRVWEYTAYVHIQKRNSFQPHAEKCVFIRYPTSYKG